MELSDEQIVVADDSLIFLNYSSSLVLHLLHLFPHISTIMSWFG